MTLIHRVANLEKTSYVVGSELWVQNDFSFLLTAVNEFIVNVWWLRKLTLYGKGACPGHQSDSSR